jgi:hypothetical protein
LRYSRGTENNYCCDKLDVLTIAERVKDGKNAGKSDWQNETSGKWGIDPRDTAVR